MLAFLMFNRPGAAAAVRAADLEFTTQGLRVRLPQQKSAARTRVQHTFLIPCHPNGYASDLPLCLAWSHVRDFLAGGGSARTPLFSDGLSVPRSRVVGHWLLLALAWMQLRPPLGAVDRSLHPQWRGVGRQRRGRFPSGCGSLPRPRVYDDDGAPLRG